MFFDYLLTLDVPLITQNLRDGLIKKIFKDHAVTKKLIEDHQNIIGDQIKDVIDTSTTAEDFNDKIRILRDTEAAADDKECYEKALSKQINKNQLDIPLKECKNALKSLENVNIKPLVEASNSIADKKLAEISKILDDISSRVYIIKAEMNENND